LADTHVYAKLGGVPMQRTAKIFMNNRSEGGDLTLSLRPSDWSAYLASAAVASEEYMEGAEDLPAEERLPNDPDHE